jgi:hypothetical protein
MDIKEGKYLTVNEIHEITGASIKNISVILSRSKIKPLTTGAIYPEIALQAVIDAQARGVGRPRKPKQDDK